MNRVVWLMIASLGVAPILLSGCDKPSNMTSGMAIASTPVGGVIRFSGSSIGGAIIQAQEVCALKNRDLSAVPIGFYKLPDQDGHDQLMTFECKQNPVDE